MSGQSSAVFRLRRAVRELLATLDPELAARPVIACSGGPDSLALAAAACAELPDPPRALVVDHQLQPDSGTVAARAAETLRALGARPTVVTADVQGPGGPEAAARGARYRALRREAGQHSCVLLGHTLDDQAETVLLGLGRGSGPRSVQGMPAWDPPWARPLLGLRRRDTEQACQELGLAPWQDPHNRDPRFRRARLRSEVLPLLEDVLGGGVAAALARTADQLRADVELLDGQAAELAEQVCTAGDELDAAALAGHPAPLRRRVLRRWLLDRGVREVSAEQLLRVDALCARWRGQGAAALPGGLEAGRVHGRLQLAGSPTRHSGERGQPAVTGVDNRFELDPDGTAGTPEARTMIAGDPYPGDIASVLVSQDQLSAKLDELAELVTAHYRARVQAGDAAPDLLLVGVLKGAVMFMTDLARRLPIPTQLEFMAVSSYGSATSSSGVVRILKDLDRDITGRDVLVVEDIIDSGLTLSWLMRNLASRHPRSLEVCALLRKPDALTTGTSELNVRWVGFDIPNEFVVGYGLDHAERYRDLPYVGTLEPKVYSDG